MTDLDSGQLPKGRTDLEVVNRPDGQALFDPATGTLHALNSTAMAIWEACDGLTTVREIADAIAELSGVEPDRALRDVTVTLEELSKLGLMGI